MSSHHFKRSMNYEQSNAKRADAFYTKQFGASDIERYDKGTKEHMTLQRKDIDLCISVNATKIAISEKFRKADFGDVYLEIYSKYPHTNGWMEGSEADYLAYFFPKRMLWIPKGSLITFFEQAIKRQLPQEMVHRFHEEFRGKNGRKKLKIVSPAYSGIVQLIQAYNRSGKDEWHTIGITLPFAMLEKMGVPVTFYDL